MMDGIKRRGRVDRRWEGRYSINFYEDVKIAVCWFVGALIALWVIDMFMEVVERL